MNVFYIFIGIVFGILLFSIVFFNNHLYLLKNHQLFIFLIHYDYHKDFKKHMYKYCIKYKLIENKKISLDGINYINQYMFNMFTFCYYVFFIISVILVLIYYIITTRL